MNRDTIGSIFLGALRRPMLFIVVRLVRTESANLSSSFGRILLRIFDSVAQPEVESLFGGGSAMSCQRLGCSTAGNPSSLLWVR